MGVCYKRCALLTERKYNYPSSATSCCLYNSQWACMTASNTVSSPDYNIGGGANDMRLAPFAEAPHDPLLELTEGTHP